MTEPRGDTTPEWEVFCRSAESEPLSHVGSVSAPTEEVAREQAESLFGWTAHTLWLCRADDVARFTARDLGAESDAAANADAETAGGESR
ncbi:Htur_1727 family rSAM-partnered candidate RiPP [Halobellus rubicundus]|uniref:Htur_1727 family rSAM-partnered candidate RiPP n=1 Tax=Halobellus rubicundus TaxID=2996466 RepID=A0ABD5MG36_9EURY